MLTLPTAQGREAPRASWPWCNWAHPGDREGGNSWLCWKAIAKAYMHLCLYIHIHPSTLPSSHITRHTRHSHEAPASISSTWSGRFSLSLCQHHRLKWLVYTSTACWCRKVQTDGQPSCNTAKVLSAPLRKQWMRPLQDKLETSRPSCCCFNITGKFFAYVPVSRIHHRWGSTSKTLK